MKLSDVPALLHVRLGAEASTALLQLLDRSRQETREELIRACTERFERRLVEEASSLRVHIAQLGADLRQEMATMRADLRQEVTVLGADLRQEMAAGRVDLFKWCFLFWIGQVLAISGVVGVMLRVMR
jgi:hypothetical protein